MGRSRSRSRSRGRRDDRREGVAEAAKSGSSEQEIVSVAIRQLPTEIRERLEKLFEEGLLKEGDLDLRSITVFASLNEGLQARVMNHMECERIYVANARSKSGFLIATCDKAKTGCLDARGLGAIDPWRTALVAMATPKQKIINLTPERDWLDEHEESAVIKIQVELGTSVEAELGVPNVTVELPLTETSTAVKAKLVAMGIRSIPANKMKLHTESVGFLKESRSFAFYNLNDGVVCSLSERKRGGARLRADHTVMPKRPRTQPAPGETSSSSHALKNIVGGTGVPGLPKLLSPPLPGTGPGVGLPALPAMPSPVASAGPAGNPLTLGLPGLPGAPGLLGLPGGLTGPAPGLGKGPPPMPSLPGLGSGPGAGLGLAMPGGLNGAADLGKSNALAFPPLGCSTEVPKAGGLGTPGLMPDQDMGKILSGLPPPGVDPKAAFMGKMGPMSMPSFGFAGMESSMSKACGSVPNLGPPSKAQMPSGLGMAMPKGMPTGMFTPLDIASAKSASPVS